MSRLTAQQAQSFPQANGRTSFLQLQNDNDSAVVRFAYNTVADMLVDLIHDVSYNGRNRAVDCLKNDYSQPDSICPLCAAGMPTKKTLYFNVRNEQTGEMQIWQRSEAYFEKNMKTLFEEYTASGTPLCSIPFKIIRKGVKGDTKTTYTFIALPADTMTLDQFPEDVDPRDSGIIKEYDFNTLQNYISTGSFPETDNRTNSEEYIQARPMQRPASKVNDYQNFGQPAKVEDYNQVPTQGQFNQQPMQGQRQQFNQPMPNNNRRTIMNDSNGGY